MSHDGETYLWPNSNSKDYIHTPLLLEGVSLYKLAMNNKKVIKSKKAINNSFECAQNAHQNAPHDDDSEDNGDSVGPNEVKGYLNPNQDNLDFLTMHPKHCFTKLSPLKYWEVPMVQAL